MTSDKILIIKKAIRDHRASQSRGMVAVCDCGWRGDTFDSRGDHERHVAFEVEKALETLSEAGR